MSFAVCDRSPCARRGWCALCGAETSAKTGRIEGSRYSLRAVQGLLAGFVMLVAGSGNATDHGITGKHLILKASKFALVSRDANAHASGSPVCPAADSSLTFADGVHTQTFTLPCANWSDRGRLATYIAPNPQIALPSVIRLGRK